MRYFPILLLLPPLVACSRGPSGTTSLPQQPAVMPLGSEAALGALTEAQSDARQVPQPLYTPGTNDLLYVSNQGNNSITVYHHNDSLDAPPIRVIAGSKTGLKNPVQLSEDAEGNLYVANSDTYEPDVTNPDPNAAVLVFARGANGNVAPIRTLAGSQTGIEHITALTVDQGTGKIFVSNAGPSDLDAPYYPTTKILRFPPNATGDEPPFAVSANYVEYLNYQLASDSTGQYLLAQGFQAGYPDLGELSAVEVTAKQFANNATPANPYGVSTYCTDDGDPTKPCLGYSLSGVADDPTTQTYLTSSSTGIQRFSEKAKEYTYAVPLPSRSTITSAVGCNQLALGYLRNIYAVCGNAINVYTHDSSGNVAPLRVLKGSATKLNKPFGIYEGQ